jgi:hypothetical protein
VNPVFDLRGSVFADDSTVMVDAVSGTLRGIFIGSVFADDSSQIIDGNSFTVYGNIEATTLRTAESKIALGASAGLTTQGALSVAIGSQAAETNQGSQSVAVGGGAGNLDQDSGAVAIGANAGAFTQGLRAVAIGSLAGSNNQGDYAVALGNFAGGTNQPANSIVINATGLALDGSAAGFFVDPIRSTATATGPLMYNSSTKELFYNTVLEFAGSTISTNDSSGITIDVQTTFNTDVTVDNELTVTNNIITGRLKTAEIEGIADELNIYSDWAKDTGISIYSETGVESVTLTSNRVVGVVTGVGGTQREWVFDTAGRIQFPDTRYQTGAAISIADLKVLVAACADFAAFKTAIAALA